MRITDPPEEIMGMQALLRRYRDADDILPVHAAIAASLEHLKGWIPWAQALPTDESVRAFLEPAARDFDGDSSANYAVTRLASGEHAGGCALHRRVGEGALEIGYWADVRHAQRGLIPEAVRLLTVTALERVAKRSTRRLWARPS